MKARFSIWRRFLGKAPASRAVGQVPGAEPVMSPEDAHARLGELRASCAATWEPPDPVALAAFLREVAETLQALEPDLSVSDALRRAAADADDAEALLTRALEGVSAEDLRARYEFRGDDVCGRLHRHPGPTSFGVPCARW